MRTVVVAVWLLPSPPQIPPNIWEASIRHRAITSRWRCVECIHLNLKQNPEKKSFFFHLLPFRLPASPCLHSTTAFHFFSGELKLKFNFCSLLVGLRGHGQPHKKKEKKKLCKQFTFSITSEMNRKNGSTFEWQCGPQRKQDACKLHGKNGNSINIILFLALVARSCPSNTNNTGILCATKHNMLPASRGTKSMQYSKNKHQCNYIFPCDDYYSSQFCDYYFSPHMYEDAAREVPSLRLHSRQFGWMNRCLSRIHRHAFFPFYFAFPASCEEFSREVSFFFFFCKLYAWLTTMNW